MGWTKKQTSLALAGASAVVVLVFAARMYATHGLDFFCSGKGSCPIINCTPANPCNHGGKTYTSGTMCTTPGTLCDSAWFEDCYCTTVIVRRADLPDSLACQCR